MKKILLLILGIVCLSYAEVPISELEREAKNRCVGSTSNFCKGMSHYRANGTSNTYDKMVVCGYLGKSGNLNVISRYDGLEVNLKFYSDSALALMALASICPEIANDFKN